MARLVRDLHVALPSCTNVLQIETRARCWALSSAAPPSRQNRGYESPLDPTMGLEILAPLVTCR